MAKEKNELELARIKREREEISEIESQAEADNEAKLKKRLEAIQKKWDERQKKKTSAKAKGERLTKDGIAEDVLEVVCLQDEFEKCENLQQFDLLREKVRFSVDTRDVIAENMLNLLGFKDEYLKCENREQFNEFMKKVRYNVKYFVNFYSLNKGMDGIKLPNIQRDEPAQNQ